MIAAIVSTVAGTAIAAADLHNLVFQRDYRIVPGTALWLHRRHHDRQGALVVSDA